MKLELKTKMNQEILHHDLDFVWTQVHFYLVKLQNLKLRNFSIFEVKTTNIQNIWSLRITHSPALSF